MKLIFQPEPPHSTKGFARAGQAASLHGHLCPYDLTGAKMAMG